jgi:hypothetical protein
MSARPRPKRQSSPLAQNVYNSLNRAGYAR